MNNSKSTHGFSETQEKQPPINSFSIEILDSSIQNLINSWKRRQRWLQYCCTISSQQDLKRAPWRTHLVNFLESTSVRVFTICLLIVGIFVVILDLSYTTLSCHLKKGEALAVWFHRVAIGILIILSAKSMALLVGLGFSFFLHPGSVMDGTIATTALVLLVFLKIRAVSLVIVVCLWRVIRVVESASGLKNRDVKVQLEGIISQYEALKEENKRLLETIEERNKKIEKLKEEFSQW
ncbi:hypothetical protein L6164_012042 [Bauhinia variegata]|uniref:Uncharacterized protein n=1 Tax=Bauhinia variegata TaxID=167791 RepID=A0ACB9PDX0_BAUVA|nr:hypothetical protein L6164_012042 [Bauhinia variegata]